MPVVYAQVNRKEEDEKIFNPNFSRFWIDLVSIFS